MDIATFDFEEHGDERGILISLEERKNIPFEIRRCYFMYNTLPGVDRGFHAHKTLRQVLVCVHGSCRILLDDGRGGKESVLLDRPNKGLYLAPPGRAAGRLPVRQAAPSGRMDGGAQADRRPV